MRTYEPAILQAGKERYQRADLEGRGKHLLPGVRPTSQIDPVNLSSEDAWGIMLIVGAWRAMPLQACPPSSCFPRTNVLI